MGKRLGAGVLVSVLSLLALLVAPAPAANAASVYYRIGNCNIYVGVPSHYYYGRDNQGWTYDLDWNCATPRTLHVTTQLQASSNSTLPGPILYQRTDYVWNNASSGHVTNSYQCIMDGSGNQSTGTVYASQRAAFRELGAIPSSTAAPGYCNFYNGG
jgi:hypothetical protein